MIWVWSPEFQNTLLQYRSLSKFIFLPCFTSLWRCLQWWWQYSWCVGPHTTSTSYILTMIPTLPRSPTSSTCTWPSTGLPCPTPVSTPSSTTGWTRGSGHTLTWYSSVYQDTWKEQLLTGKQSFTGYIITWQQNGFSKSVMSKPNTRNLKFKCSLKVVRIFLIICIKLQFDTICVCVCVLWL